MTTKRHANYSTSFTKANTSVSFFVPNPIKEIIEVLEIAGYETWLVGGFVRDSLRNVAVYDFDIASQAPWQTSRELCLAAGFAVYETGTKHGTITVINNDIKAELTTYRFEGSYSDHRHPDEVVFVSNIEQDLARRDFTINAMAYHPVRGLLDIYGGQHDLENKLIRSVGDARVRFSEDYLRILRAIRFASQLGFSLESATLQAAYKMRENLNDLARERIHAELDKFLCGAFVHDAIMDYVDILGVVLPELLPMKDLDQKTRFHVYDVLEHSAYVVQNTPAKPLVRWAALCHDMGKPDTFFLDENGVGHMYGHPEVSVEHLKSIARRLRFSNAFTHDISLLVRWHDMRIDPLPKHVRKLYLKLEQKEYLFRAICELMRADSLSQAPFCHERTLIVDQIEACFDAMLAEENFFSLKDLPLSGKDLVELGVPQGPQVGLLLQKIFDAALNDEVEPTRKELIAYAKTLI